jgi:hypothetical protein
MPDTVPLDDATPPSRSFVQDIFVNAVQFEVGVYDVAMTFGVQGPKRPPEYSVRLRMSPQHALVMCAMLMSNIRAYESQVGAIALPADMIRDLKMGAALEGLRKLSPPAI